MVAGQQRPDAVWGYEPNTVYQARQQRNYHAAVGTEIHEQTQFPVRSIVVDNYSSQFVYVAEAGRFVPPYTFGAVLPANGQEQVNVTWQAPGAWAEPAAKGQGVWVVAVGTDQPAQAGEYRSDLAALP